MPWKETCPMEQRVEMVGDWLKNESSITELSRIYGVSRVTIYKWLSRFKAKGPEGFTEHSRAPRKHPNAVPAPYPRRPHDDSSRSTWHRH